MSNFPAISELIPHRGEMVKLDALVDVRLNGSEVVLESRFEVREGELFLRDGVLRESVLVEIAAQTVAAGEGFQSFREGSSEPPLGYLVGIEKFRFFRAVKVGDTVFCRVELINSTGPLRIMGAVLKVGGEVVAEGILKLYRD